MKRLAVAIMWAVGIVLALILEALDIRDALRLRRIYRKSGNGWRRTSPSGNRKGAWL